MKQQYKVVIAQSGKIDVKNKKHYILQNFKYREYAENFSLKIKKAAEELAIFPTSHQITGFQYRGYDIYMKPQSNHLLFYTIDNDRGVVTILRILQDGMDWEYIIQQWIQINS
ncbi:MAG: type II toxin-antitoxin system RelE/ParE family toxin [Lachnospiraceae bacterium]|nr:type II toxin-antitoxin system RelE/ParE family toxin [Lachnospiraceae bacterium]